MGQLPHDAEKPLRLGAGAGADAGFASVSPYCRPFLRPHAARTTERPRILRIGIGQTRRTLGPPGAGTWAGRAVPHRAGIILQDAAAGNPSVQSSFGLRH